MTNLVTVPGTYQGLRVDDKAVSLLYADANGELQVLCRFNSDSFNELLRDIEEIESKLDLDDDPNQPFLIDPYLELYKKENIAYTIPASEMAESRNRINQIMQEYRGRA